MNDVIQRANDFAKGDLEGFARSWLNEGKRVGREWSAKNPTRNDAHPGSFKFNIDKGRWKDWASGDSGSDPVSLVAYLERCSMPDAARRILGETANSNERRQNVVQLRPQKRAEPPPEEWQLLPYASDDLPLPAEFRKADRDGKYHSFRLSKCPHWAYRNASGQLIGYTVRCNFPDGSKDVYPLSPCRHRETGEVSYRWKAFAKPRPIYGLDRLAANPSAAVVVVEGEKKADAANPLGLPVIFVAWPSGAAAVHHVDWSPLYGRKVAFWPDNDDAGRKAFAQFVKCVSGRLERLAFIEPPADMPKGWDVADGIADGWTAADVAAHIKANSSVVEGAQKAVSATQAVTPMSEPANDNRQRKKRAGGAGGLINPTTPITPYSDDEMALHFAEQFAGQFLHVGEWAKWLRWDGSRWTLDVCGSVMQAARLLGREFGSRAMQETEMPQRTRETLARTVSSVKKSSSVVAYASTDEAFTVSEKSLDTDQWLLNTPGGTVDLRTGQLRPSDPADYITKSTAVAPAESYEGAHTWFDFLDWATGQDVELMSFLQRVLGYSLTGDISEHALFFMWGSGGNGKGTFINTARSILADYGQSTSVEVFMESKSDRHPTEIARMKGARFLEAQETNDNRSWDSAKLKSLSGGDKISARLMGKDFFEFTPNFKLIIAGNHPPLLKAVDNGIRRRLHFIPFTQCPVEADTKLHEKIEAEWPYILRWMIEGCLEWQRIGLSPPPSVRAATSEYLDSEDNIGQWMTECVTKTASGSVRAMALFESWKQWAMSANIPAGSDKALYKALRSRGIEVKMSNGKRVAYGLELSATEQDLVDF